MPTSECRLCDAPRTPVSEALGVCVSCIRHRGEPALGIAMEGHAKARSRFGLPPAVPTGAGGARCRVCSNGCVVAEGALGYCGMRTNLGGHIVHRAGVPSRGLCAPYHDPHPTNCVAQWLCPERRSLGRSNLAVFYLGCSFDCLYCQNWSCRMALSGDRGGPLSSRELADMVDGRTSCVCFFGGDPGPHSPHALRVAGILAEERPDVRICWETNGAWSPRPRERMIGSALASGGIIKVDLKAGTESVHRALTGRPLAPTLETIEAVTARAGERTDGPPLLVVSTLLVPGYVDGEEVGRVASMLAELDPMPPLSLLAFHPDYEMGDLPPTSRAEASAARRTALDAGLKEVHIGNAHILW